ncbi:hypothetical protein BG015_000036 [Linnemannia schmuckeri]|uniref:Uncharacterized protein n=1 Tax=Linnemannia schmuckeri TaxID=64567 RepID=A0A9P5SAZ3_9FUNG|nr:hypothetical protein BG015_000036 [Linnemannia schmuckeri]
MALAGFITFIRILVGIAALAVFGVNQYFLYLYRNHNQVVFHWRFYSEISISGALFFVVIISETAYRIARYNDRSEYLDGGWGGEAPKAKRGCGRHFWTIFRFIWAMIFVGGILSWVVPAWMDKQRIMFTIPVGRDTPEADAYRTGRKKQNWLNPRDIFDCPAWINDQPLTYLCKLDEQALYCSALLACLAFIEGLLTLIIESRRRRVNYHHQPYNMGPISGTDPNPYTTLTAGHVVPMDKSKENKAVTKKEEQQPKSIFRSLKEHIRRDEDYDVENNYGSSGYNPNSTYVVEARHVGHEYTDRSLPPLPARPTTEEERHRREEEEEEVRSDSAMIPKSTPVVPVDGLVPTGTNPFLNEDQLQQQQLAYAQAAGSSSQSPYHATDVKRADGY